MATRIIDDTKLQNIAVAIQGKDSGGTMTVDQMPTRITAIPTGQEVLFTSDGRAYTRSLTFSNSVTSIKDSAYYNCPDLEEVNIPSSVAAIQNYAFSDCVKLKTVVIADGALTIGTASFKGCSVLESVTLPNGATQLGQAAFRACFKLKTIAIPNTVTTIKAQCFSYCSLLEALDLSAYSDPSALPTMENTDALVATSGTLRIEVLNQTMLDAFAAATNWSAYAAKLVIKS